MSDLTDSLSFDLQQLVPPNIVKSESAFQITLSAVHAASKLFNESTSKSLKTPISLLQEICSKSHVAPASYELLATEGQMHQPIFVYKCVLNNQVYAIAKGNSKKRAKHSAALEVLNQIKQNSIGENNSLAEKLDSLIQSINELDMEEMPSIVLNSTDLTKPPNQDKNQDVLSSSIADGLNIENIKSSLDNCENPVGELIEIAQRYSMRPPDFQYGEEDGPPHNRQFTCFAIFGDYKETGNGRAKKLAKRQAAIKLLFRLKTSGQFNKTSNQLKQETINSNEINNSKSGHSSKKNPLNFLNQFKSSKNSSINYLLNNELENIEDELNLTFLKKLASEEKFGFVFTRLPTNKDKFRYSLELKINSGIVLGGNGDSIEEAKNKAVYYALSHIKLMCSRGSSA